ncbi:LPXTG cell wall anchor domain-containing protein [Streptococcus pyogenes]|uniref:LPXTG cell wall anchor domain-containing protein n=3 Tax=Streptococcus pyogenes TaxID=1314 RepID=UPI0010D8D8D0|nr:extracellular matrix binding protein [Streptococcus pyogenes]VHJ44056.1 extracellular matrix binding protein [Streptococcus pyogenes]
MFLKHQDVKQKNWRMRKVKKVFVSSCMLLTVGLGVAVPTGFSQSNGVMVVKAAEVSDNLIDFNGTWKLSAAGSSGRFFSKGATDSYVFHFIPAQDVEKAGWHEHNVPIKDSYVKITKESIAARYTTSTKAPYSVAFKVNTKPLIKDHDYKITFEQGQIAPGITVDYRIGSAFNHTTNDSFNISDEKKYASNVKIEGEEQGFKQREQGDKTISFRTLKEGAMSLVLLSKVNEKPTKNSEVEFRNFKIIDVTKPSQLDKGVAYVGNRNVELTLKSDDGRTNFEGDEISLFNSKGELLQTVTVTKDQQNPISITLSEDQAKSLKNKEKLKVSIKQKQSKKTSDDFFFEVGIDPEVKAKQQEKLLELDKVKKQIEDSINGDAWLPEKPEGEKPVQNTNKELQLQELNKKYQMAKEAIESATTLEKVTEKYNEYTFEGEKEKYPNSLRNQYTRGDKDKEIEKAKKSLGDLSDKVNGKIEEDKWLSDEVKKKQQQELEARKQKVNDSLKGSDSLKSLRETVEKASSKNQKKPESFEDVYVPGNEETEKTKVRDILQKTYQKTEQNIETDPWLSPEQKKAQKENAKARLDAGLKAVETTESLDKLKEVESDFLDKEKAESIPSQHQAGTPEVARKTFLDNFEKEAKKEIESIKNDATLTDAEKATAKAKVEAQLQEAKDKAKESKSFDDLKNIQDKFNSELPHTPGKPLKDQQSDAIAELEKKQQEIEKAIEGDKTLPRDEKKKQIADSKERLKSDTQKVKDAKNADAIKKAFEEGKVDIPQAHIPGDLNKDKEKLLAELKQKADDTEKAIDSDKALTAKEKEEQKAKTKEELQKATEAVGAIDNREELDKKVPELKKAIEDTHVKGNLEGIKNKAIEDLKKAHTETVAKINGDDTLDKATKEAQVKETDKALAAGKDAITKADDADKVSTAVTEHTPKIKAAHKTGDLKKAQVDANTALDKAAEKEREEINNDITLTAKDKEQQLKEVETALTKAKDNVKAAKTADAINDARDKGVATIDAVHKAGQDLGARKSGQVAKLEEAAKATKDKISADPTLTSKEKEEQSKAVDAELKKAIEAVNAADTADKVDDALGKGVTDIKNQHKTGDPVEARREAHGKELDRVAQETKGAIEKDPTLTTEEKAKQVKDVDVAKERGMAKLNEAKDADALDKAYGEGVTDIKNQHKSGDPIEARRGLHNKSIDEVAQATKDAITADTTLTEAEKETQRGNVDKEATKAKEELAKAKDADALDKAYGDGVTSIKNQHKSGKGLDVRKDEHKKALEAVAKRVTAEIEADPTLTPEVREQQKAEVQKELELATDKIAEAKDADEADKAYGDGVTAIENAHVIGKGIEARKDLAKKDLAEAVAKTKALIIEDKTLTDDQRKEQLSGVDTEYAKGIENIDVAKDAAGVDKAYSDGVRDILAQYKEGQNLDDRRNAAKEFLLKEADKVTKLINDDPTLTHDQKVDQINKVEQAKLDAIKSVDDAQTADAINDALGKGIENINNQYQHGDGVDVRKATAKGDLEKEAAKVKALIAKDPTLTQADKDKQTAAVDAAKNTAIAAVDKATTADGVNQELGKGITAINKAYRPGEGVKARKEAAKADLEKEAAKVKALIAKDPTLTQADKDKQTAAVDAAKNTAIAAVDKATTADGVNQELGKGITAINKAYRPGEGVKARKEAAKADLEKEAAKVKALIAKDPTLTQADKDKQTAAVDAAKNTAIAAVDKATTAEGINQELGKGITAINKAYRPGEGVKARKEAAKADLEKEAAKVKALITNDPTLTKADKAKQTEAVAKALKAAIAAVDKATTAEGINQELGKGITAINKAYRPGEGVKARKEAAKANLEKVAKETKALISGDRYLSETEKAAQKQAVEQALAKALGQVETAKTVEAVKLAENLGTVAIRSAYVAGLAKDTDQATAALNEAKQAAIEALKQAAAETLAKITTDAKLTEAQKAEQSENVSLALKTAIATVRSAQSIASVKEAKDKGITAIRAAYVPNKAVAKSSSANHLPKSGDANSIVLVGLGVMSLLLGMVLYSKKKESKD